ncbi:helix-turn-helix domain-containing protein [Verrucomicrobiota bacterium]
MSAKWIKSRDIGCIEGALKASVYITRAYRYVREHGGRYPQWAKKSERGHWLFDSTYIKEDAEENRLIVSISEAARILGASRRTIQNWADEGIIATVAGEGRRGEAARKILREQFMQTVPELRKRLETAAVIGRKVKEGKSVSARLAKKAESEKKARKTEARERDKIRHREQRIEQREEEQKTELYIELEKVKAARKRAADERKAAIKKAERKAAAARKAEEAAKRLEADARTELRDVREVSRNAAREAEEKAKKESRLKSFLRSSLERVRAKREKATKEKAAAIVEMRLKAAVEKEIAEREMNLKALRAKALKDAELKSEKRKKAEAIEARLKEAREEKLAETEWEKRAITIARKITDDMFDRDMDQLDAVIMFNDIAEDEGIPREIHIKVRKEYIGR